MKLWPHQERALRLIDGAIKDGYREICVTGPPGSGKTRMMIERVKIESSSALYTDRTSLFSQLCDNFEDAGVLFGCRASGYDLAINRDTQLIMSQSENEALKRQTRMPHWCSQVLVDECHNQTAPTRLSLFNTHSDQGAYRLGWTATPLGVGHCHDHLIVAANVSDCIECGALVRVKQFAPNEPDKKLVGLVKISGGECAIEKTKREEYCFRVVGSVVDHYNELNPDRKPALLFAPGVEESKWFCDRLNEKGITAAHIDGEFCYYKGELIRNNKTNDIRKRIAEESRRGLINVVCNRFVLREGIDWPWLYHGIFATIFGGLTSWLQAGGRLGRNGGIDDHAIAQDHGGNCLRHGSLNADREWHLALTDARVHAMRKDRIKDGKERAPIVCPKCSSIRLSGSRCATCGLESIRDGRRAVLQADGSLKRMTVAEWKPRRLLSDSQKLRDEWRGHIIGIRRSKKATVATRTFNQVYAAFAQDHNWAYPPRTLPMMPKNEIDWYLPVKEVSLDDLI